jgi:hypothetical protein
MGAADFATKTQNKSLGFNAVWRLPATCALNSIPTVRPPPRRRQPLRLEQHPRYRQLQPRRHQRRLQQDFPVLSIAGADFVKAGQQVTGSNFTNGYMRGEVEQTQVKGAWKLLEASN